MLLNKRLKFKSKKAHYEVYLHDIYIIMLWAIYNLTKTFVIFLLIPQTVVEGF